MAPQAALSPNSGQLSAQLAKPDRLLAAVILGTSVILPLLFLPVQEDAFALPKVTLLRITFGLSIPLLCIALISLPQRPAVPPLLSALMVAYVGLNALAFAFSVDPRRSFLGEYLQYQGFTTILIYAGTFYLGARIFGSRGTSHLLFWAVALGGLAVSAYGVAQMLDLDPLDWSFGSGPPARAFSSVGQSSALAAYLVMVIPLAVALLTDTRRAGRWLLIAVIAIASVVLALTYSRGGYLGILIAAPVALLPFAPRVASRRGLLLSLATVALLTVTIIAVSPLRSTADRVVDRSTSAFQYHDWSLESHLGMWDVASKIALDRPLLGTGQETYPAMFSQYRDAEVRGFGSEPGRPEGPHNNYLAIASSTGIPSLAVYLGIVVSVLYLVLRRQRTAGPGERAALFAICAAVLGHLVTDAFATADVTSYWLFWLLMGAGVGMATSTTDLESTFRLSIPRLQGFRYWPAVAGPIVSATGIAFACFAVLPLLAETEASQAASASGQGNWYAAAMGYDRAAGLNPFESRYLTRGADAYLRAAESTDPRAGLVRAALGRYGAANQRFAPEAPFVFAEARTRALLAQMDPVFRTQLRQSLASGADSNSDGLPDPSAYSGQ